MFFGCWDMVGDVSFPEREARWKLLGGSNGVVGDGIDMHATSIPHRRSIHRYVRLLPYSVGKIHQGCRLSVNYSMGIWAIQENAFHHVNEIILTYCELLARLYIDHYIVTNLSL